MRVNPSSPREWRDTGEVSIKICAGRIKDNSLSNCRPLKLNTFFQICSHTAICCQNIRSLRPRLTFTASYRDISEREKMEKNTVYKHKNTTDNYLHLQIMLRTVQLLTTTTVQDSIQAQTNVFFGHVFAEVTLSSLTHTLLQLPQKVSPRSLFLINSKCRDIRSYLLWHPSHLVMWTE